MTEDLKKRVESEFAVIESAAAMLGYIKVGEDKAMQLATMVRELISREEKLAEALKLLLEAKHIKETFGKGVAYEQLKSRGWEAAEAALKELGIK